MLNIIKININQPDLNFVGTFWYAAHYPKKGYMTTQPMHATVFDEVEANRMVDMLKKKCDTVLDLFSIQGNPDIQIKFIAKDYILPNLIIGTAIAASKIAELPVKDTIKYMNYFMEIVSMDVNVLIDKH